MCDCYSEEMVKWAFIVWCVVFAIWLNSLFEFFAQMFFTDATAIFWLLLASVISPRARLMCTENSNICGSVMRNTNMILNAFCAGEAVIFAG